MKDFMMTLIQVIILLTILTTQNAVFGRNVAKTDKLSQQIQHGSKADISLKCTDCPKAPQLQTIIKAKDVQARDGHTESKTTKRHRRRKGGGRKHNSGRKHNKHRKTSTGSHLKEVKSKNVAVETEKLQKDIPGGRWSGNWRPDPRDQERRYRPLMTKSVKKLRYTLTEMLQRMERFIGEVKNDYSDVRNITRHDFMEVRKILQEIAKENDEAYDVMLDVSQLMRYIMLRAHQHGLVSPSPMVFPPGMMNRNFSGRYRSAAKAREFAKSALYKAMDYKWRYRQMDSRMIVAQQRDQPKVPEDVLVDLQRISRQVLQKINGKVDNSMARIKLDRYQMLQTKIKDDMMNATDWSRKAYQDIKYAQRLFQDNKEYQTKIKIARASPGRRINVEITSSGTSAKEYEALKELTQRTYMKARNLQMTEKILNRTIVPLLKEFKKKPLSKGESALVAEVRNTVTRLQSLTMKMERKLDELRVYLGNEDVLRERCEDLAAETQIFDSPHTIIDCELFGFGSGSGDEELIAVSVKPRVTTTPPTQTSTTPLPDIIDGSGDGEFSFTDKETKEESNSWFSIFGDDPNAGMQNLFKRKLEQKASDEKSKSEELNNKADKLSSRFEVMKKQFSGVFTVNDQTETYVILAQNVTQAWKELKPEADQTNERVKKLDKNFFLKLEELQNKSRAAQEAAKAKVDEYVKASNKRKTDAAAADAEMLTKLIAAVDKVKENTQELKQLKDVIPDPCRTLQRGAVKLRNNIAELRAKIQKVKQITKSLPLSVSLKGDSRLVATLSSDAGFKSPTTSFGMCIKPATDGDMHVATFAANSSVSYGVELVDGAVQVVLTDSNGDELGDFKSSVSLTPDSWYRLDIKRYGNSLEVTTDDLTSSDETVTEAKAMPDTNPLQVSPHIAIIGATQNDQNHFSGCIGQITVNGKDVGLLDTTRTGPSLNVCKSNCFDPEERAMIFEGDGYTKYDLDLLRNPTRLETIRISFRSRQKDGVVLLLNDRLHDLQVLVSLMGGAIHVEGRTRRGTTVKRSGLNSYADGLTHNLEVKLEASSSIIKVDNGTDVFGPERSTQEISKTIDDGIFLGGLGVKSQSVTGKTKLRPLTGCITNFRIGNQSFPFYLAKETKNVYLGDCMQNIWTNCVRFQEDSMNITIDDVKNMKMIYLVVSKDSVGQILHYKNGEKFNLEIRVSGKGLEIFDVREDDTYVINAPADPENNWFSVRIQDKPDEVIISLNGVSETVEYTSGGGWFGDKKKDDYRLSVGGAADDVTSFTGSLAKLLINDKPVDLLQYADGHKLTNCEKPIKEVVEIKEKEEKLKICS